MERWQGNCKRCDWLGPVRINEDHAKGDAVWHVYEQHTPEWLENVGNRPPRDFDPRAVN